jgi:tetraacyldisaccharide 4'-kinase
MSLLPDADRFRRLVDGRTRGAAATLARAGLAALALPYGLAVSARNAGYDRGLLPVRKVDVPVISVGNLTLGGTGKTPLVAWVVGRLLAAGRRPAIASRGYGAAAGDTSDEAAELGIVLPGVPHVAHRDRVRAATAALAAGADVIVLDDGFQHRRLHRDLDIVAIDATDPFGSGHLFPRGLLREPTHGLRRAEVVVLTRSTAVDVTRRTAIRDAVVAARGGQPLVWAEAVHAAMALRTWSGRTSPLDELRGRRILAFAAIGNPAAFRQTLEATGAEVTSLVAFPDHHAYGIGDLERLAVRASAERVDLTVTTLKDLVKIRHDQVGATPLVALQIALEMLAGDDEVEAAIASVLPTRPTERGSTPSA